MNPDRERIVQVLFICGCALCAGGGNLLLKAGMSQMGSVSTTDMSRLQYAVQALTRPQVLLGGVLYLASFVMWLSLLSMMDISVVYPIFVSGAFLLVTAGSVLWLGEQVTTGRIVGTLIVALGIALVSISKGASPAPDASRPALSAPRSPGPPPSSPPGS